MPRRTTCQSCRQVVEPITYQEGNVVKSSCPVCDNVIWEMLVPPARPRDQRGLFKVQKYGAVEIG